TKECLLSKGRNPDLTKSEIELKLKEYLGAKRVIWLPYGVIGDETNGHVDNICAFTDENTVVLGWTEEEGLQKSACEKNLKVLEAEGLKVIKIPFPEKPVTFTPHDLSGFVYEKGEIERSLDEPLAATYVNFYVCNAAVLVPVFADKNDEKALEILRQAFPHKKVVPVYARELILGGGNIHCLTQQIPK
ncbi:MAG: agmatine deiminase family protein, partial [Clostridia bacterium]|nr:agmatine deiminase family protein [Clostridia bacterium]